MTQRDVRVNVAGRVGNTAGLCPTMLQRPPPVTPIPMFRKDRKYVLFTGSYVDCASQLVEALPAVSERGADGLHERHARGQSYLANRRLLKVAGFGRRSTPGDFPVPYPLLFRHHFAGQHFAARWEPYWGIGQWQSHLLKRHANYLKGLMGSPDEFATLLYFSAVTITTLGFGDIVPITRASRFAVSIEATWGLFVIGLFLNSLAREFDKRSHDRADSD